MGYYAWGPCIHLDVLYWWLQAYVPFLANLHTYSSCSGLSQYLSCWHTMQVGRTVMGHVIGGVVVCMDSECSRSCNLCLKCSMTSPQYWPALTHLVALVPTCHCILSQSCLAFRLYPMSFIKWQIFCLWLVAAHGRWWGQQLVVASRERNVGKWAKLRISIHRSWKLTYCGLDIY